MPGLVLIDGGLGQLHAAAEALEALGILNQPLASIAKREEIIYVYGQEDEPVVLDRRSPVLHLVQTIRDEAHRFAVTFHRNRRDARTLTIGTARHPRHRPAQSGEAAEDASAASPAFGAAPTRRTRDAPSARPPAARLIAALVPSAPGGQPLGQESG